MAAEKQICHYYIVRNLLLDYIRKSMKYITLEPWKYVKGFIHMAKTSFYTYENGFPCLKSFKDFLCRKYVCAGERILDLVILLFAVT